MKCMKCATSEAVRKSPPLCAKCYAQYLEYLGPESITMKGQRGVFVKDEHHGRHQSPIFVSDAMRIEREVEKEIATESHFESLVADREDSQISGWEASDPNKKVDEDE